MKVVDFGIAKAATQSHKTKTGPVKGKVAYMAPEQLRSKSIDRRADVYALGVVLYELVSGAKPYEAESEFTMIHAVLYEPIVPIRQRLPDVPEELEQIITKALANDRDQRYAGCREMCNDLERYVMAGSNEPVGAFQIAQLVSDLKAAPVGPQLTPPPGIVTPNRVPASQQTPPRAHPEVAVAEPARPNHGTTGQDGDRRRRGRPDGEDVGERADFRRRGPEPRGGEGNPHPGGPAAGPRARPGLHGSRGPGCDQAHRPAEPSAGGSGASGDHGPAAPKPGRRQETRQEAPQPGPEKSSGELASATAAAHPRRAHWGVSLLAITGAALAVGGVMGYLAVGGVVGWLGHRSGAGGSLDSAPKDVRAGGRRTGSKQARVEVASKKNLDLAQKALDGDRLEEAANLLAQAQGTLLFAKDYEKLKAKVDQAKTDAADRAKAQPVAAKLTRRCEGRAGREREGAAGRQGGAPRGGLGRSSTGACCS